MSTDQKFKLRFTESNVDESITYILVKKFNIEPNVLRAEVEEDGGTLLLKMKGEEDDIKAALEYLHVTGIEVTPLSEHIVRDRERCIDCGSCISVCPTRSFSIDPETWEVHLNCGSCIACGSCLTACPVKAISLTL